MRNVPLIVVAYAASALLYSRLPDAHWWLGSGDTSVRLLIAFLLPTAATVISGLLGVLARKDPFRDEEDTLAVETTDAIISASVVFVLTLHFLILSALLGVVSWAGAGAAALLLVAWLLTFTGNALPRTRPNIVVGIRTERTLTNRRVWLRTHRFLGNVSVGLGGAMAVAAFLPHGARMMLVGAALLVGAGAIVACTRKGSHA